MAGVVFGKIDCKVSTATLPNNHQEVFIIAKDFFERGVVLGHCTRIASQFGASGTGLNFHDLANPAGENAFVVYRFGPAATPGNFFVLVQYAQGSNFGTSPGNPGVLNGVAAADGLGIAIAARVDGSSPWGGGTANAGADAKSTPVWTSGSHVIDRACSAHATAGSFATNKENCIRVHEALSSNAPRIHCVGDADQFAILCAQIDDGNYSCFTAGKYVPRDGLTADLPLYVLAQYPGTPAFWLSGTAAPFGTGAGTGTTREGGILGRDADTLVGVVTIAILDDLMTATLQPNNQMSPVESDGPVPLLCYLESGEGGHVGQPDGNVLRYTITPSNHELNSDASRARMSRVEASNKRWSVPWDGGLAPGLGATRAGREF